MVIVKAQEELRQRLARSKFAGKQISSRRTLNLEDVVTSPERPWESIRKRSNAGKMGPFFPPHQGERDPSAEEEPEGEGGSAEVTDRGPSPSAPRARGLAGVDTFDGKSDDDDEKSGSSDDDDMQNAGEEPTERADFS